MRVSQSQSQKRRRDKPNYPELDFLQNSIDYYNKPIKQRLECYKLLPKQQSPARDELHTTSCRIKPQIITQPSTEHLAQKSLITLPARQLPVSYPNRSFIIKHKKATIQERYKQIMSYNVEEQFVELRRLMSRKKKAFSLGKRVKFLQ